MWFNRNDRRNESGSILNSFGFILLVIFLIMCTFFSTGCMEDTEYYEYVQFHVTATASAPSEIIVPIPECTPVVDRLTITEGKGEFTIIETVYGRCLKVNFDTRIVVKGTWSPRNVEIKKIMTINLTTMNPNETEPYSFTNRNTIIPNKTIWVNWSYGLEVEFVIKSRMTLNKIEYLFGYYSSIDTLDHGWTRVLAEGGAGGTNAP